jgi:prolyl-tRNA editing enzyme YbaK/EbsC (Cys-tRNA(Pro) deacylase)
MWSNTRVHTLVDVEDLGYEKMKHSEAFTALDAAVASRISGREMAKAVVLHDGSGRYLMAVVPATCRLGHARRRLRLRRPPNAGAVLSPHGSRARGRVRQP